MRCILFVSIFIVFFLFFHFLKQYSNCKAGAFFTAVWLHYLTLNAKSHSKHYFILGQTTGWPKKVSHYH